jgi:hypothetical protein
MEKVYNNRNMKKFILLIEIGLSVFSCFPDENDNFVFNVGNIIVNVPQNYICGYYDGIRNEYIRIDNKEIISNEINKNFSIIYFRKDSNFRDPDGWGYEVGNIPDLENYVRGLSEIRPKFFVREMRRNKLKDINICETLTLGRFEIFDKIFEHQIIFTDNDFFYCISIHIWGWKFGEDMMLEIPEYFNLEHEDNSYGAWIKEKLNEIYENFNNFRSMPAYLNELFIESNSIFNDIQFIK